MRRISARQRFINRLVCTLIALGIAPDFLYLLKIPGRKSGKLRVTPISLLLIDEDRWVVAGFQEADWVKNAYAARWGILSRGRFVEKVALIEVKEPSERAPLLREQVRRVQATRRRITISPDAPLAEFEAIASLHPTFRIARFSQTTEQAHDMLSAR
jgi:F420H(2)-dependent quinone reductase